MTDSLSRLRRLLRELKRRKVYRAAAGYLVAAFVAVQLADLAADAFGFPGWFEPMIWVLAAVGFPLAIALAWAFEVTPEGVRRTTEAESGAEEVSPDDGLATGYRVLVGLGLLGAAVAGGWYLTGGGGQSPEIGDRSVAVLPFEALGRDESGTFTEGMHSDLQTRLSNIAGLTVTSSRSVERYRGSDESTAAVARDLGVGWIVSGDVQRMADQIQVNVRLVDPATDTQAWTDSYRRDLTADNLFQIQTDITRNVAQSLEAELSPDEAARIERRPTEDLDAYQWYVQGRKLLAERSGPSIREATEYFERAIRRDSTYARAWAGLADARLLLPQYASDSTRTVQQRLRDVIPEAETAVRRAVELDPDLAEAHASRGILYIVKQVVQQEGHFGPRALRELRRAVELKPSYAEAHHWLGSLQLAIGRPEAALKHLRLAMELSPENVITDRDYMHALVANGRYEEALSAARTGALVDDGWELITLVHLQRWDEVREVAERVRSEDGSSDWVDDFVALADLAAGDSALARDRLQSLQGLSEGRYLEWRKGLLHAALGQDSAAIADFERIEWRGSFHLLSAAVRDLRYYYPHVLGPLRGDPRYQTLITEVNRIWGLDPDGSLPDSVNVSFDGQSDD